MPQRTCAGCRAVEPQTALVRVVFDGVRLVADRARRLPGRGAYVHARKTCVTIPGLARSFRRQVSAADLQRILNDVTGQNDPGLVRADAVETAPRIKAEDDRSEDARL